MLAKKPEDFASPEELTDFYTATFEFPAGFMTQYTPSMLTGEATAQSLASGFPIGKRFKSARAVRVADANPVHLGHHHRADGRWRMYVLADAPAAGEPSEAGALAEWLASADNSPIALYTPDGADVDAVFDVKVVYQQRYDDIDLGRVPAIFMPRVGPFGLIDYEKVYAVDAKRGDFFDEREIDRNGCLIIVRPDQYVAHVLPLSAREEITAFFARSMTVQQREQTRLG